MIELVETAIDTSAILDGVYDNEAGAVILFLGTTRSVTNGRSTESLDYECYPDMSLKKLEQLERIARERWPIKQLSIVHRLGKLKVGEASVAVAVSCAHRKPAFEAGQWLIDTIKEEVPIWKKENWEDGTSDWVHPGVDGSHSKLGSESK